MHTSINVANGGQSSWGWSKTQPYLISVYVLGIRDGRNW